ncbi:MAG: DUF3158 family protein [Pirellulales bacterium]|nr:DUF3158 family protein [Pirellulales bacterium]
MLAIAVCESSNSGRCSTDLIRWRNQLTSRTGSSAWTEFPQNINVPQAMKKRRERIIPAPWKSEGYNNPTHFSILPCGQEKNTVRAVVRPSPDCFPPWEFRSRCLRRIPATKGIIGKLRRRLWQTLPLTKNSYSKARGN